MSKRKVRKSTFRQSLRATAELRLEKLTKEVKQGAYNVCLYQGVNAVDVMRLICNSQTKSLRHRVLNELVNDMESELEKIWNDQQVVPLKEKSDADQETA